MKKGRILIAICAMIGGCMIFTGCGKDTKVNKTVNIKEDNIKLTVHGSEQVTVDDELSIAYGEYIKVKVTIENTGDTTYEWSALNFGMGGEVVSLNALAMEGFLVEKVEPGKKETGYLYFTKNDSKILDYNTQMKLTEDGNGKMTKYTFKIK